MIPEASFLPTRLRQVCPFPSTWQLSRAGLARRLSLQLPQAAIPRPSPGKGNASLSTGLAGHRLLGPAETLPTLSVSLLLLHILPPTPLTVVPVAP